MIRLPVKGTGEFYSVQPTKILALGLNYTDHIAESVSVNVKGFTKEVPPEPILFSKTPNVLTGPDDPIILPSIVLSYGYEEPRTDYEAELAIIIGEKCKHVNARDAFSVIYGYTCMNDVSQRNIQNGDRSGWFRGKSFDTFGPVGPCVVLKRDLPDPQNLNLLCRLNGSIVQNSHTGMMIFKIPEIIEYITRNFTLYAGDIISTGTPSGVGPIRAGDTVEVEIEGIGILRNHVINE